MKSLKISLALVAALFSILFSSCLKLDQTPAVDIGVNTDTPSLHINVPDNFNYETSKRVSLDITLLTNDDNPLPSVLVNVLDKLEEEGGKVLFTALTDRQGKITVPLMLPTYLTSVVVDAAYIGLMRNATVSLVNNSALCTIGGSNGFGGNVQPVLKEIKTSSPFYLNRTDALTYKYMGTYNAAGKPNYLLPTNDVISASLLSLINTSLPEGRAVPTYHPAYLSGTAETNLNIVQQSDVSITFVHEGAGYKNTLAYFTYPTNTPPTSTNAIDTLRIILPNASLNGSGGELISGNKVKLGNFAAGTSIGFCVIANGWSDAARNVGSGANKFYSIDNFNPETTAANRRHTVLLNDAANNLLLIGFEDLRRDQNSDNDFNDIIFYATTSVRSAIAVQQVNPIDQPLDSDTDGVSNVYDQFPNDPLRAYVSYYPSASTFGTIAFEDAWPKTGDYDLNDMVVDYRYKMINNPLNKTIEIYADYILKASGALFSNGFGVQFPFAPSAVSSVTGGRLASNYISLAANGCEAGQAKAVIIPFDNFKSGVPANSFINTVPGASFRTPDTLRMKVTISSPLTAAQLGTAPFNQFLIKNLNRGMEVHLPGELPTDKANIGYFNTNNDNTIPSQNRYYKTSGNLPFAINFPENFAYPLEGKAINNTYLKFTSWAESGGSSYADWYKDLTGYRFASNLYSH